MALVGGKIQIRTIYHLLSLFEDMRHFPHEQND